MGFKTTEIHSLTGLDAAAKSRQLCPTLRSHRRQPTRLPRPWDSPGKNTGVGCHFLLQCMKVKSESEVAQSCPTLHDPMDCSPPGSSVHGIFQARGLEWGSGVPLPSPTWMLRVQNPDVSSVDSSQNFWGRIYSKLLSQIHVVASNPWCFLAYRLIIPIFALLFSMAFSQCESLDLSPP